MTLQEILELLLGNSGFWATVIMIILTLVEITPIKINPWSWIGRMFNKEVMKKIDGLQEEVNTVKKNVQDVKQDMTNFRDKSDERDATGCRTRILRFGDEILHGVPHSKEHYDQILLDIDSYEEYCDLHQEYKNNVAVATMKRIKAKYQEHLEEDSFL